MKKILFIFLIFVWQTVSAQEAKKSLTTQRVDLAPKIDGVLDDAAWENAEVAGDFIMSNPTPGTKENPGQKTEVRVAYDDRAVYFSAYLHDDQPQNMMKQLSNRDAFGRADRFAVIINPANDQINDVGFNVEITGNQIDLIDKPGRGGRDINWSAVWDSAVKIVDDGWIVEIKIPYAALRFSSEEVQTWGINFYRFYSKSRNTFTWNPIDRTKGRRQQYAGVLNGIQNIKPPTRLSFYPYASTLIANNNEGLKGSFGMDLKYGINESFTLDATLIPDFGQTAFDNVVLNLGPFEQRFQEQRAFFTEGVELFSKGNMFYSRRIGNKPSNYYNDDNLDDNEELLDNPNKVNLINAMKVSGRTKNGLGIGIFNAITEKTFAKILNTGTQETRKSLTEPLTNYNVMVFDQQFRTNSSVTFVNTNVMRKAGRKANASALLLNLRDKSNRFFVQGEAKMSNISEGGEINRGYFVEGQAGKYAGKVRYELQYRQIDENFNINDLGFANRNNYKRIGGNFNYRIFTPTARLRNYRIFTFANLEFRDTDGAYIGNFYGIDYRATTLKRHTFWFHVDGQIGKQNDYYEPRVEGMFFKRDPRVRYRTGLSTDFSKKFAFDGGVTHTRLIGDAQYFTEIQFSPRYRFSDRFSLVYEIERGYGENQKGYVTKINDDETVVFGDRIRKEITNSLSGQYAFNVKSSLALTFRHYWSPIKYDDQFYTLNDFGGLDPNDYSGEHDVNYNIWNFDLSYIWQVAPGSQLAALYRNNLSNEDDQSYLGFGENLDNLFDQKTNHNFSLKLTYFLDYNRLKR